MRRLICTFVVSISHKTHFRMTWPKSLKMCIKSDFEEIILKFATYGQREKAFLLSSKLDCLPLPEAIYIYIYIYMVKHEKNVYKTSIFFKPATNGQRIWDFYWHQHLSPRGCLPLQWAISMYKSITIYTRASCQVSIYRTTGPLVILSSEINAYLE